MAEDTKINFITAQKAVNKAYYKMPISRTQLERFADAFDKLLKGRKAGDIQEMPLQFMR